MQAGVCDTITRDECCSGFGVCGDTIMCDECCSGFGVCGV